MKKALNILKFILLILGVAALMPMLFVDINSVDMILGYTYVLFAIAVVAAIVMTAVNFGKSNNNSKIGIIVFGLLIVAAVVAYFTASSDPVALADGTVEDSLFALKLTDTLLYVTYAAFAAVVVLLIGGEIRNSIK